MTKFIGATRWLEPFYNDSKYLLGNHRLDEVRPSHVPKGRLTHTEGSIIVKGDGRVVITMLSSYWKRQSFHSVKQTWEARNIGSTLVAFAHELAHLKYWEHTTEHWYLQCYIMQQFGHTLQVLGIGDHEAEIPKE